MQPNIGIDEKHRREIAEGLSRLLADTYTLYLRTQNFHWNVKGPNFQPLHALFETQYRELAEASDFIAERIRALGAVAPGSFTEFAKISTLKDEHKVNGSESMIKSLLEGHESVVRTARYVFPIVDNADDAPSADLLSQRMQVHEKAAWMLRSMLQK
jgi:starvation-inducible DNA-binding protein